MLRVPDLEQKLATLMSLAADDRDGPPPGSATRGRSARSARSTSGVCARAGQGRRGCSGY